MNINSVLETREAKLNFLKGIIRIAKCDGEKDDRELVFYHQAALSMGLEVDDIMELNSTWNDESFISINFEKDVEKMFFFIQAVQLCWIDDKYTMSEKQEIYQIAKELNISPDAISKVEAWVAEGIEWNNRGELLLGLK